MTHPLGVTRASLVALAGAALVIGAVAPAASATTPSAKRYSMAQVKKHATPTDCWTAINGSVYDLTTWIARHPGGSGPIIRLCGTNGSRAFMSQHGGDGRAAAELRSFRIGKLR